MRIGLVLQGKWPQRQGFRYDVDAQILRRVARPFVMVAADQGDAQRRTFCPPLFQRRQRACRMGLWSMQKIAQKDQMVTGVGVQQAVEPTQIFLRLPCGTGWPSLR